MTSKDVEKGTIDYFIQMSLEKAFLVTSEAKALRVTSPKAQIAKIDNHIVLRQKQEPKKSIFLMKNSRKKKKNLRSHLRRKKTSVKFA